MKTYFLPYTLLLLQLTGCESFDSGSENLQDEVLSSTRTITTTFVSYQDDTQQKDNKIVAIADFNADGTIASLKQYTSYPYDRKDPVNVELWTTNTIKKNIHLVMDGITLGDGEKNFLYGNNWPKLYVKHIEKNGHSHFSNKDRGIKQHNTSFRYTTEQLPSLIETIPTHSLFHGFSEKFSYDNNKVTIAGQKYLISENNIKNKKRKDINKSLSYTNTIFKYDDNDQLVAVKKGKKTYLFTYKNTLLTSSKYLIEDKVFHRRVYHYNENNQKTKTEIYNANDELEYAIKYHYDYFPD